jgi:DNA polymerase-3 subunit delta
VLPLLADHQLAHLLEAASLCDGIVKGLKQPGWPLDPWAALQRLALMLVQAASQVPAARGKGAGPGVVRRLALQA